MSRPIGRATRGTWSSQNNGKQSESYARRQQVATELLGRVPTADEISAILAYSDADVAQLCVLRQQRAQLMSESDQP